MPTSWTPWMRWNEIFRVAVGLGYVDYTPGSPAAQHGVQKLLRERMALGLIEKRKHGAAQSAKAEYRFKMIRAS